VCVFSLSLSLSLSLADAKILQNDLGAAQSAPSKDEKKGFMRSKANKKSDGKETTMRSRGRITSLLTRNNKKKDK
jgi:hypothetical protein